jgi:hypothetical protein
MAALLIIFLLAFLVESLVEYLFGRLFDQVKALQPHRWLLMYIAAAVGVGGCFFYGFDLLYILGGYLGNGGPAGPGWFGVLLTGLAVGRGSNYIHDLVAKFFVKSGAVPVSDSP